MGNASGLEIERKWLLGAAPSSEWLRAHGAVAKRIEQVYLRAADDGEPGGRRVRRIETDAGVEHVETRKRARGGFTREEVERSIEPSEYERSLDEAEPSRQPVRKTRWVFPYAGHQLELDVFEAPAGVVLLEIELDSEDEPVELPPDLPIVREVTDDRAYLNWNLAKRG
jgi:CYTH domain-containing protein